MSDFETAYPFASQAACREAIKAQGLTNHYASGGRRNGVDRYAIAEWPTAKHAPAPVAKSERTPRASGAKAICADVFADHNCDKVAFVAECVARGVFEGTAKARWTDLVRAAK